jgi:E3 ubiquitin-protein ligase HUWE1
MIKIWLTLLMGYSPMHKRGVDRLQPLLEHSLKEPFFAPLINPSAKLVISLEQDISEGADDMEAEAKKQAMENVKENGTVLVKDLVTINSLTYLLRELYGRSIFNVRQSVHVFLQTAQEYDREGLIIKLGSLQRQCVWEEIQLQKGIPSDWDEVTKTKDPVAGVAIEAPIPQHISSSTANSGEASMSSEQKQEAQKAIVEKDGNTSWFRNVKTIRFLIGQIPTSINPFLQGNYLISPYS